MDLIDNAKKIVEALLVEDNIDKINIEIITFSTQAKRKQTLTNNKELLLQTIDSLDIENMTYIEKALQFTIEDITKATEANPKNFVFILTDGQAYDIDQSKDEFDELKKLKCELCAIMIGGENKTLKAFCGKNYHQSTNLTDQKLQLVIKDFIENVKKSVQITGEGFPLDLSDEADKDYRNSQLKAFEKSGYNELFRHKTTYYFKCLEMNYNNLTIFKNYAKELIKNHNDIVKTKEIKTLSNLRSVYSKETQFNNKGPNFYFLQKPKYTLSPTIKISNVNLVSVNGPSLIDKKVPIDRPSYFPIQDKDLYGSTLKLKYSVEVKNLSEYNAKTDYIKLICYIPKNSVFIDYKIIGKNVNKSTVNLFSDKVSQINKNSINRELKKDEQYLSEDIYTNIENGNYAAVFFDIPTNKNGFNFTKNASLYIEYQTNSILDYNDDLLYNGFVEILGYTNKQSIRRLQETNVIGAVAGNDLPSVKKIEIDSARSNDVVLLEPTGADKKITFVKVLLTICIISSIIIIFIKRKVKYHN